ncbi:MAG: TRAP transporter large permease subunit, partial [Nitrospinota bacterium]|nr:TRAP transporter large permease subunit [Nitrospinota bacterium]
MGLVMIIAPVLLLLLGYPVFICFLGTSAILLIWFMEIPLAALPQVMFGSVDKYTLLAVPFFIFAGEVMGRGGISKRIIRWVLSMFGGVRGSLGLTTVGTCEFFGAISGSSPATVAAVGRVMYPALRENGYEERFSLGLVTASGAIAGVIPPSIVMILYGASAEQSVAHLFIAGFFPGILIGLLMAAYILWYAKNRDIPVTERFDRKVFFQATLNGAWALGTPLVILGGIYTGVFTPTEAAGIAGAYGLLVTLFIYRDINWKGIWEVAINATYLTSQIMIIVASSGVFSWILTVAGIPDIMVSFIQRFNVPPWGTLVIINIFLIIVGALIDPTSAILVLTPLLLPIVKSLGVDLIHFGIIMAVNLALGMFTPPFGLNIFVSQSLFKVPAVRIVPGVMPFVGLQVIALALITFIPEISLYLT